MKPQNRRLKRPSFRKNPVTIGRHPSLFEGGGALTPVVVADWRGLSDIELMDAARRGELTDEEVDEIGEEISKSLADQLFKINEDVRERRVEKFVEFFQAAANWRVEYETEGDGKETYIDIFQEELDSNVSEYVEKAKEFLEEDEEEDLLAQIDDEMLTEVLGDPDLYDFEVNQDEYARSSRAVWSGQLGSLEEQFDDLSYGSLSGLSEILDRLSEADINTAMKKLENDEPYVSFHGRRWDRKKGGYEPISKKYFNKSFSISISQTEGWRMEASIDMSKLVDALREKIEEEGPGKKAPGAGDDIIYRYSGDEDSIAGPFARGMYVVRLRPDQLKAEGAALKHCVGRADMRYDEKLRRKEIALYSIRDAEGTRRFTIEIGLQPGMPPIKQAKGKVNRLPGFEGGGSRITRPDEITYVVEFLTSLGYTPEQIKDGRDIGAGVRGMLENGLDPFAPANTRSRKNPRARLPRQPRRNPEGLAVSPEVERRALRDYERPWGGRWGT